MTALGQHVPNWQSYLCHGVEAAGVYEEGAKVLDAIATRLRTGRLLGSDEWIAEQELALDRELAPKRPGPKPRVGGGS